eukprot:763583-Hanusia_phi.AAC.6
MKKGFLSGAKDGSSGKDASDSAESSSGPAPTKKRAEAPSSSSTQREAAEPSVNLSKQVPRFSLGPLRKSPVACLVLGMAGSGKTTLMQRIAVHIHNQKLPSYIINLDPAVSSVPYGCNIDIRDTVNYKQVMKEYELGPNGGILTSLNLFATKFDQVMGLIEQKADSLEHIFVDTPGQIEIFTWSASGTIISDMFAYSVPTALIYVVDTPRTTSPVTFMSNMLYACSIMYKFKTDVTSADFAILRKVPGGCPRRESICWDSVCIHGARAGGPDPCISCFLRGALTPEQEFYRNITTVCMSAVTGEGVEDLFDKIARAAEEYANVYRPMLEAKAEEKQKREAKATERRLQKMREQMAKVGGLDNIKAPKDEDEEDEEENEFKANPKGGFAAFEPDSDDLDDGEDDVEFANEVSSDSPIPSSEMTSLHLWHRRRGRDMLLWTSWNI